MALKIADQTLSSRQTFVSARKLQQASFVQRVNHMQLMMDEPCTYVDEVFESAMDAALDTWMSHKRERRRDTLGAILTRALDLR